MHFYYDIDEWEMYDLEADPMEMKNVYDDPAYVSVREDLHKKIGRTSPEIWRSDELNAMHVQRYLDIMNKRKNRAISVVKH